MHTTRRAQTADFTRVALFTMVVVAHCVNAINRGPDEFRAAQLVGTLSHLSRYGFVAVTLYVLVLSMRGRTMTPMEFWRRRFGLVLMPYLVWSVIYAFVDPLLIESVEFGSPAEFVGSLGHALLVGEGKYQLYFLLISMQIYLLFPFLTRLTVLTERYPWRMIGGAAVLQMIMFVIYQWLPRPSGHGWDVMYEHLWKAFPMYALFAALGVAAAQHQEAVDQWLREHVVTVVVVATGCLAFSTGAYLLATSPGDVPGAATTAWNPLSLPWYLGGLALLWLIAVAWDDRRAARRRVGARAVSYATLRAFGVFALHPLILDLLGYVGFVNALFDWFPQSPTLRSILFVVAVLGISLVVVDVLMRTPLSRWLTARDRKPLPVLRKKPAPRDQQREVQPAAT